MHSPKNILITGAGAPGIRGTLFALLNNPDHVSIRTIGVDVNSDVVGRFMVDAFYEVPPPESAAYLPAMLEVCRCEAVDLILPQTTREIVALSNFQEEFRQRGIPVAVSSERAINIANSKLHVLQAFEAIGLPFPAYVLARSEDELICACERLGYPGNRVVVKPPVSNGMRGLRILTENPWTTDRFLAEKPDGAEISLFELLRILRNGLSWPELLVTEYLSGPEYSVDAFAGARAAIALPRLRKTIRSGISFANVMEFRQDVAHATLRAAAHIGLQYAFGFQFKLDSRSQPKVLECNPRVQGTMVASVFSGVNVIWLAVKEALGESPDQVARFELKPARFYRFWGGIGVKGENGTIEI